MYFTYYNLLYTLNFTKFDFDDLICYIGLKIVKAEREHRLLLFLIRQKFGVPYVVTSNVDFWSIP
jgi:hypothetical protein